MQSHTLRWQTCTRLRKWLISEILGKLCMTVLAPINTFLALGSKICGQEAGHKSKDSLHSR